MQTQKDIELLVMADLVRELAYANCGPDEPLEFYDAAIELGCSERDAWSIAETLNLRALRVRGG